MKEYNTINEYINKINNDVDRIAKKYPKSKKRIYEPLELPKRPEEFIKWLSETNKIRSFEIEKEKSIADAKRLYDLVKKLV